MKCLCTALSIITTLAAQPAPGPPLPHRLVRDWAQLPPGWNFGEATGVDVDRDDNVWVFNRGPQKVIQFDKHGRVLSYWKDIPIVSAHGLEIGPDGSVWLVDVKGHAVFQFDRFARMRMVITNSYNRPGDNDSKYFFNEPTGLAFAPDGSFYVADGYVNSRVVKYNRDQIGEGGGIARPICRWWAVVLRYWSLGAHRSLWSLLSMSRTQVGMAAARFADGGPSRALY